MWLDAIALILMLGFSLFGARKGAVAAGMGLLCLAVAYTAAISFAGDLGTPLAGALGAPELLAIPLGGTAAFAGAFACMSVVSWVVRRQTALPEGYRRSIRDRFVGGVLGTLRGGCVVLLLSYLALWVDALRVTGAEPMLPAVEGSTAAVLTEQVVEAGVEVALGEGAGGRVAARIASRPGATLGELQALLEDPRVVALQQDRLFWAHVEGGSVDSALNQSSFWNLSQDAELRGRMAEVGLVDSDAAADAASFRAAAREVLSEVGPRIRGLSSDPELQELLEDPEVVAMVESGDTIGLVAYPGFRSLVARVASQPPPE